MVLKFKFWQRRMVGLFVPSPRPASCLRSPAGYPLLSLPGKEQCQNLAFGSLKTWQQKEGLFLFVWENYQLAKLKEQPTILDRIIPSRPFLF
jgi:hypothetical protein